MDDDTALVRLTDHATGIVMGLRRCSAEQAAQELERVARRHDLPVWSVAAKLVHLVGGEREVDVEDDPIGSRNQSVTQVVVGAFMSEFGQRLTSSPGQSWPDAGDPSRSPQRLADGRQQAPSPR